MNNLSLNKINEHQYFKPKLINGPQGLQAKKFVFYPTKIKPAHLNKNPRLHRMKKGLVPLWLWGVRTPSMMNGFFLWEMCTGSVSIVVRAAAYLAPSHVKWPLQLLLNLSRWRNGFRGCSVSILDRPMESLGRRIFRLLF